jgi:ABC-type uncharacterized transport system involved in gliding motility auxiliary subunit
MAEWGVKMDPKRVVGDLSMALQIRARAGAQVIVADYPPWMIVDRDNLNADDPITSQLSLMRIATAGAIEPVEGASTTLTPLIRTTGDSMLYDQAEILRRGDPTELAAAFKASGTQQVLAARITGSVDTAFPDGPPPPPPPPNTPSDTAPLPQPPLVAHSEKPLDVILVADTDMLTDDLNVGPSGQQSTQNADFVMNALDTLTGGGQLIALRGQGLSFRPFTTVDKIEAATNDKYRATADKLQTELKTLQDQLTTLLGQTASPDAAGGGNALEGPTAEQQQAIAKFNQRIVEVRQQLRDVRGALRQEIDALGDQLRLLNILAVPLLIVLAGIIAFAWRQWRLSRYLRRRLA